MLISLHYRPPVLVVSYQTTTRAFRVIKNIAAGMGIHASLDTLVEHGFPDVRTWGWGLIALQALLLAVTSLAFVFFRRRYLSPISFVPGPFWASISRWWHIRQIVHGDQNLALIREHDKHGM